jgi:hypothetical protein
MLDGGLQAARSRGNKVGFWHLAEVRSCRLIRPRDGLPKFKDFPAEIGGSGEQMAE